MLSITKPHEMNSSSKITDKKCHRKIMKKKFQKQRITSEIKTIETYPYYFYGLLICMDFNTVYSPLKKINQRKKKK